MKRILTIWIFIFCGVCCISNAQEVSHIERKCTESPEGTICMKNGIHLYHYRDQNVPFKPYVDLLCPPSGRNILRDSPHDHVHHHALMFAVSVDDVNFWEESSEEHGKQISTFHQTKTFFPFQKNYTEINDISDLDWKNGANETLLREHRVIDTQSGSDLPEGSDAVQNVTMTTWTSTLSLPEGREKAVLGGGHYYGLGMRFHSSMDDGGRFFASAESQAETIRGDEKLTRCNWMAYTAKLEGAPVTVAIFDEPKNPAPMLVFTMGDASEAFAYLSATTDLWRKPMTIVAGQTITFRYQVVLLDGETDAKTIETLYQQWLKNVAKMK